jgi:hypothetical protein
VYVVCTVINSIPYPSPDIIGVLRSKGMRWTGMGKMGNAYRIEQENVKGKYIFGDQE